MLRDGTQFDPPLEGEKSACCARLSSRRARCGAIRAPHPDNEGFIVSHQARLDQLPSAAEILVRRLGSDDPPWSRRTFKGCVIDKPLKFSAEQKHAKERRLKEERGQTLIRQPRDVTLPATSEKPSSPLLKDRGQVKR